MAGLTTSRIRVAWGVITLVGVVNEALGVIRPQRGDTLSELVDDTATEWEPLPLAVGIIAGHWFWRRRRLALFLGGVGLGIALWRVRDTGTGEDE